uniref:Granulins domain-containing protein n=1 Tax=Labrus bergylta TaxID=56723 RepID=A0A3Q3EF55_9LABR
MASVIAPTIPRQGARVGDVACDESYSCPDDSTCCKTTTGDWACCPFAKAVCCDDHEHCCPSGTTCDLATLSCEQGSGSTPMQQKIPAFATRAFTTTQTESQLTECDPHTTCPQGTTCCFMKTPQKWGCCPLPEVRMVFYIKK